MCNDKVKITFLKYIFISWFVPVLPCYLISTFNLNPVSIGIFSFLTHFESKEGMLLQNIAENYVNVTRRWSTKRIYRFSKRVIIKTWMDRT